MRFRKNFNFYFNVKLLIKIVAWEKKSGRIYREQRDTQYAASRTRMTRRNNVADNDSKFLHRPCNQIYRRTKFIRADRPWHELTLSISAEMYSNLTSGIRLAGGLWPRYGGCVTQGGRDERPRGRRKRTRAGASERRKGRQREDDNQLADNRLFIGWDFVRGYRTDHSCHVQ